MSDLFISYSRLQSFSFLNVLSAFQLQLEELITDKSEKKYVEKIKLWGITFIFIQATLPFNMNLCCFYNEVFKFCEMETAYRRAIEVFIKRLMSFFLIFHLL